MTVSEAKAILFVGETIRDLCKSLREDQIAVLSDTLDLPQKVLFLGVASVAEPMPDHGIVGEVRQGWWSLVEAAKVRIAIAEDPLRAQAP
jgi:hypothetical protein